MNKWISLLVVPVFFASLSFAGPDPLGQKANYKVDLNPARTSNMIKGGTIVANVAKKQETASGPTYIVDLNYTFKVTFLGNQTGVESVAVEEKFFTEEFIKELREKKHYEGENFKADHMGFADAKTLDGKMYKNCDKILMYDMKKPPAFVDELFARVVDDTRAEIKDMKALLHIYQGLPVLGGAKVDISGKYQGNNVKAGADYMAK